MPNARGHESIIHHYVPRLTAFLGAQEECELGASTLQIPEGEFFPGGVHKSFCPH